MVRSLKELSLQQDKRVSWTSIQAGRDAEVDKVPHFILEESGTQRADWTTHSSNQSDRLHPLTLSTLASRAFSP